MTTVRVRELAAGEEAKWDSYVLDSPHSQFGQVHAWKRLTESTYDVRAEYRIAERDGRFVGALPLFRKPGRPGTLFSAPGGLLADDASIAEALLAPAREQVAREGLAWLELRDQRVAWPGLETNDEHLTMVLELEADAESQWKQFDAKLRNQIRKGEKAGFTRHWGGDRVGAFHRVMVENLRDLGTPVRGVAYFQQALDLLESRASVLVIEREGDAAGTMFTIAHRDALTDPWASSLRRHFAHCPNQVLYWEAIQRAFSLGLRRFDFGRSQWESPTYRFKQQWGARPVPLHYQYILGEGSRMPTLESQKDGMALAVKIWQRLPVPLASALGEPAKRRFPEVL